MNLPSWPNFSAEEIAVVSEVLESGKVNYWTGPHGKAFEQEFADYCGVSFAVATANGSLGLGAALRVLDIGSGDEVIVSPRSFFASAAEIVLAGATPVFADVDRDSQNITAESVRDVLSARTRAIICVHLSGWPCDMPAIKQLADTHNLVIIEDCAQAHGAFIDGKHVGSWGDIGVFSFCQDKIMSTGGEGGMLVTAHRELFERLWSFKDHGKSLDAVNAIPSSPGFRWCHDDFGTNLRMTELQAALGRWQLRRLDEWVGVRRRNAAILQETFADTECVRLTNPSGNAKHSYYKYYIFIRPHLLRAGWSRDRILTEFIDSGIPGLSGSCPEIYREKAFQNLVPENHLDLPIARELGETSIMFLVHPGLEEQHLRRVADTANKIFLDAQRI